MTDLKDYMVSDILPSSIAEDENITAISKTIDEQDFPGKSGLHPSLVRAVRRKARTTGTS